MYDSTTATDIPATAKMVAGYIDGVDPWKPTDWLRFPFAVKVRIARNSLTNDGHVLDIENGDARPEWAPAWVKRRRSQGLMTPCCYVNRSNWPVVAQACDVQRVAQPLYWVSTLDGTKLALGAGIIACQFAGQNSGSGGHFDVSTVADFWPGVDSELDTLELRRAIAALTYREQTGKNPDNATHLDAMANAMFDDLHGASQWVIGTLGGFGFVEPDEGTKPLAPHTHQVTGEAK